MCQGLCGHTSIYQHVTTDTVSNKPAVDGRNEGAALLTYHAMGGGEESLPRLVEITSFCRRKEGTSEHNSFTHH